MHPHVRLYHSDARTSIILLCASIEVVGERVRVTAANGRAIRVTYTLISP